MVNSTEEAGEAGRRRGKEKAANGEDERCIVTGQGATGTVLTAESFLQAPELHGCAVGREPNVVQVG